MAAGSKVLLAFFLSGLNPILCVSDIPAQQDYQTWLPSHSGSSTCDFEPAARKAQFQHQIGFGWILSFNISKSIFLEWSRETIFLTHVAPASVSWFNALGLHQKYIHGMNDFTEIWPFSSFSCQVKWDSSLHPPTQGCNFPPKLLISMDSVVYVLSDLLT